jgi:hypothetical protein
MQSARVAGAVLSVRSGKPWLMAGRLSGVLTLPVSVFGASLVLPELIATECRLFNKVSRFKILNDSGDVPD